VSGAPAFREGGRYMIFAYDDGKVYANPIVGGSHLLKNHSSQVAYLFEVAVPGTGHVDSAKSPDDQVRSWWIVKGMPL
jgi:hypothetical protein